MTSFEEVGVINPISVDEDNVDSRSTPPGSREESGGRRLKQRSSLRRLTKRTDRERRNPHTERTLHIASGAHGREGTDPRPLENAEPEEATNTQTTTTWRDRGPARRRDPRRCIGCETGRRTFPEVRNAPRGPNMRRGHKTTLNLTRQSPQV